MALITITEPGLPLTKRMLYFGVQKQKYCMNCGRIILEERDFYSRRFCSVKCKDEYCSPIKKVVKTI